MRTIIDLRNDDERVDSTRGGVETIHIPLDRLDEEPEFWVDWMNGPQFATPLYYRPFLERFPERIERVLDAVEQAQPGGVLFHCVGGRDRTGLVAIVPLAIAGVPAELIADDYALGAERAHTRDPVLEEFLAEKGTSARELVIELAPRHRPGPAGPTCPACCLASSRGRGRRASGMGARGARSSRAASDPGSLRSRYCTWTARRMPWSPTGSTSGRPRWNIRNMCALHSPMPFTAVSCSITSSSGSSSRCSSSSSPFSTCSARSRR